MLESQLVENVTIILAFYIERGILKDNHEKKGSKVEDINKSWNIALLFSFE